MLHTQCLLIMVTMEVEAGGGLRGEWTAPFCVDIGSAAVNTCTVLLQWND